LNSGLCTCKAGTHTVWTKPPVCFGLVFLFCFILLCSSSNAGNNTQGLISTRPTAPSPTPWAMLNFSKVFVCVLTHLCVCLFT
jgi:hypothetical protein